MQYYLDAFRKYAVFKGRASRAEYWYFALFHIMIAIGLSTTSLLVAVLVEETLGVGLYYLVAIYVLGSIIPVYSVGVRRLHDTGRSGWNFLWSLIPYLGAIPLLIFFVLPGDKKENKYGVPRRTKDPMFNK